MKKILSVLLIAMLVLTGCSTPQTDETTTLALQAEGVEAFNIEITGTNKNISKVVLISKYKDAAFADMTLEEADAEVKRLIESQDNVEGVTTQAAIEGDIATVTITMVTEEMTELPSAFLLSDVRTVKEFKSIGVKALVEQFKASGATIVE